MGDYRQMLTSFIRSEYMLHLIIYLCWILSPIKFKKIGDFYSCKRNLKGS
jgi:hypothetical protein